MTQRPDDTQQRFDVIVVGAGFAGLYLLHRLRSEGWSVRVFEAGSGVGGTWFWNRYPGARCDVESMEYSYQFSEELQQEWEWTERYAGQPEILRYLEHVADRFDLRRDIQFDSRVLAARWDEGAGHWRVRSETGEATARYLILATGCLSASITPEIPGSESFRGAAYHTGRWPHEGVDFTGQRVGVIGTGSSGVQAIPKIAEQATALTVFQRTPTYAVPAHNAPLDPAYQKDVKARYAAFRQANRSTHLGFGSDYPSSPELALEATPEAREARYEERWQRGGLHFMGAYLDLMLDGEANATAADFVRRKIMSRVRDPEVARRLAPEQVLGCKRLCVDTGYYEAFNRDNVTLVDVSREPIEAITRDGLVAGGREYGLDCIVYATGFDAMTGSILRIDPLGAGGERLAEKWAAGPRTFLGLGTAGFPNLFFITGPGSPSVLTNMVPSIEHHVGWIAECMAHLRERGLVRIEARESAENEWVAHVNALASATLFPSCNSWYLGANVPGKPRVFMPYLTFPDYAARCEEVVGKGYEGFDLS